MQQASEWRAGAGLLFASIICATCAVIPVTLVGVLVKPLGDIYGWSRATVAAGLLLTSFGTLGLAPLVGPMVDRIGPRRVAMVGLPLVACGTASIGLAGPSVYSWYAGWIAFAVAQGFANAVIWSNAVVSRFDRSRGTALGVLLAGQALCFGVAPLLALTILDTLGWRWIFFLSGLVTLLIAWPLAWRFFYAARDIEPAAEVVPADPSGEKPPFAGGALRSLAFWQIAASFVIAAMAVSTLIVHLQPILIDTGVSSRQAAAAFLIVGPAQIAGRLLSGVLLDRIAPHIVASLGLILPAIAYAMLSLLEQSTGTAYASALLVGLAAGAEADMLAFVVSRYFPKRVFGAVYSLLLGIYAVGFGVAPTAAGAVFDAVSSYQTVFMALFVATTLGAILILSLGRPRLATG